jgi:hypothetical protein
MQRRRRQRRTAEATMETAALHGKQECALDRLDSEPLLLVAQSGSASSSD